MIRAEYAACKLLKYAVAESIACELLGELNVATVLEGIKSCGPENGDPLLSR
jgi:hypothetical protein